MHDNAHLLALEALDNPPPIDPEMERRKRAAQATLDHWRDRAFSWEEGNHCARMITSHLRRLGVKVPHGKAGTFKSALAARAALKRVGFRSLAHMADHYLLRIPAAAAKTADLVELPSADGLGAMMVALGNGRVLGYIDGFETPQVLQPNEYGGAWNVLYGPDDLFASPAHAIPWTWERPSE
jgi:hypothetical protein